MYRGCRTSANKNTLNGDYNISFFAVYSETFF